MQTHTLVQRDFVSRPHERSVSREVLVPEHPQGRRTPQAVGLIGAALVGLLSFGFGVWYVASWPGLAIASLLLVVATAVVALRQARSVTHSLEELERVVVCLAQAENVNLATSRLSPRWQAIGQRFIDSHSLLLRELRERQSAVQKLELNQSLVLAGQRRAEAIVDSLSDAVLVTNSFGELSLANPEAERLFGFRLEKARGKPVRQLVSTPALANLIEQGVGRAGGNQRHTEELSVAFGGKALWFKVTVGEVVDSTTEHLGIVTVLRDVTKEKAAQARSAEFVSAVSHEIKTPLASVKAYAEMLGDGDADGDPETQQKFLNIIEVQTDRMTRLLDGMLDMARIESGVVRVEKKLVSLNELIDGGAKLMEPAAADKNLTIETRLSSLYLGVNVDPDMMSRVVMNLISNAIKYTDAGGKITLRSQIVDDQVAFEVEDTGRGIPAEAMPRLFQKFYRVKENAGAAPGTGLGLSLVKHIVEESHGGKIEVESQVGKGSTFRVKLPLERLN